MKGARRCVGTEGSRSALLPMLSLLEQIGTSAAIVNGTMFLVSGVLIAPSR